MPTYEYKCEKCGNHFEIFQQMSANPLTTCPKCGGKVNRLIGLGAGIIFKGHGFYETDYKNGGNSSNGGNSEKSGVKPANAAKPKGSKESVIK